MIIRVVFFKKQVRSTEILPVRCGFKSLHFDAVTFEGGGVRLNGGGNNYKNKPIVTGIIRTDKINQVGKFFVIIGQRTFSACQNLVNEFDNYTNAIFIGQPTAENVNFCGDSNRKELPNSKISVCLSFAWWQDKPQWENAP